MKSTSILGGLKRLLSIALAFFGGSVVIKPVDYDDDEDGDAGSSPCVLIKMADYDDYVKDSQYLEALKDRDKLTTM